MMKTENLTWAEAIRAYVDGKRIRDKDGDEYWLEDGVHKGSLSALYTDEPPYSIVQPEVKSLSFEDCLLLDDILIMGQGLPEEGLFCHRIQGLTWDPMSLMFIDLAERKGWKIYARKKG